MSAARYVLARLGGSAVPSTRPVTRVESPQQAVNVDWLNATFPAPSMTVAGLIGLLGAMLGRPVTGTEGRGLIGFAESVTLHARHGSMSSAIGSIAWGGDQQRGRWLLQLTGVGCQLVRDWDGLQELLAGLGAKLTRVDLALDFHDGQYSVDDSVSMVETGGFQLSGRSPQTRVDGDWIGGRNGRTLYVGQAKNGKMLRVYEKGRQLGDPESEWTRFEVQLGSRDRILPLDCLTRRDAFFAGCYPALAEMVNDAAEQIKTLRKTGETSLAHMAYHLKRCYGKLIHACLTDAGASYAEFVEELRVIGLPRRVPLSSLAAGVNWSDVTDQIKRVSP